MKIPLIVNITIFLLQTLTITVSRAQYSFSGTSTPNATIGTVMSFTKTDNTANNVNFTTANEIANGITVSNVSSFAIKSNVPWIVSAASATTYFTASGSYSSSNMPASIITLGVPTQNVITLSTVNKTLTVGKRGDASVSGNTFSINLTANPGFSYGPGSYSIIINYTLTAQ